MRHALLVTLALAFVAACKDQPPAPTPTPPATGHWELAKQTDSRLVSYKAPVFEAIVIQPLSDKEIPELAGMQVLLQQRFPAVPIRVAAPQPFPADAMNVERDQAMYEQLIPHVPNEHGTIAVITHDLGAERNNFFYANWETTTARGVVSISRFRSADGKPTHDVALTGADLERARQRVLGQLTSTIGKLLGMSFPCREEKCALKFPRDMTEFDAKGVDFCPTHQSQLAEISKRYFTK